MFAQAEQAEPAVRRALKGVDAARLEEAQIRWLPVALALPRAGTARPGSFFRLCKGHRLAGGRGDGREGRSEARQLAAVLAVAEARRLAQTPSRTEFHPSRPPEGSIASRPPSACRRWQPPKRMANLP